MKCLFVFQAGGTRASPPHQQEGRAGGGTRPGRCHEVRGGNGFKAVKKVKSKMEMLKCILQSSFA